MAAVVLLDPQDSMEVSVAKLNNAIAGLTRYGTRQETVTDGCILLAWSNAFKRWYAGRLTDPGERTIDANQLVVSGEVFERVDAMIPHLAVLPLYYNSTEARMRGDDA